MSTLVNLIPGKWKVGLALGAIALLGFLAIGVANLIVIGSNEGSSGDGEFIAGDVVNVSADVLRHQPLVEKYAAKYGVSEYVNIILALMMQESGGQGNDPMQSSESFCGSVGCITDVETSIDKGVLHFSNVMAKANYDVKLALQSYNYGGGFIDYVMERGGKYTKELAISFSQMMYKKLQHTGIYSCVRPEAVPYQACYGDFLYVDAVLKYVNTSTVVGADGNTGVKVVDVGYRWIGNSTYVFGGGRNAADIAAGRFDCSSFVHWAFKEVGVDLGPLTSTSTETLKHLGKSVSPNNMKPGDLVFFDTYKKDGHVGIYVGDGKFIGAQSSTGVAVADMSSGYWAETFNGRVKRIGG
ncbi:bifunctional lytic transglycosylase/C40 family peptidase [Bacillus sp. JJ722]|uniref:bifunctional lytic transglycosylase/C40 family peptidase n=1 Tax=Bacillus sp. JJ722 TaxID=3122973 RepID=UPI002FFE10D7